MPCFTTADADYNTTVDSAEQTYNNSFDSLTNLFGTALDIIDNGGNVETGHFSNTANNSSASYVTQVKDPNKPVQKQTEHPKSWFYYKFWGSLETKLDATDPDELGEQFKQRAKSSVHSVGRGMEVTGEVAAALNSPTVALETLTGQRATSTIGEKVSIPERLWNLVTSALGLGVASAAGRLGDDVVKNVGKVAQIFSKEQLNVIKNLSKIAAKYGNFKCKDCADELVEALKKAGIKGKTIEIFSESQRGGIFSDTYKGVISSSGKHVGVLVDGKVYDNIHKNGIPYDQWLADFHGLVPFTITTKEF